MKKTVLPFICGLLLLISCTQNLPPEPGIPGSGQAPIGKAGGTYAGFDSNPSNLTVNKNMPPIEFALNDAAKSIIFNITGEDYVYKRFYVLNRSAWAWEGYDFDTSTVGISNWISGDVGMTFSLPTSYLGDVTTAQNVDVIIIAYGCKRTDEQQWDCHGDGGGIGIWMLRDFEIKWTGQPAGVPLPPPLAGSVALSSLVNGFAVKDDSGNMAAYFNASGNLFLKGTKHTSVTPFSAPTDAAFVFADSTGAAVAYIDAAGSLYTKGTLAQSQSVCTPSATADEFIVQDTAGNAVSLIDLTTGNLYLAGSLLENRQFT